MNRRELNRRKHRLAVATEDFWASATLRCQGREPTYAYPHPPEVAYTRLVDAYNNRWQTQERET